MNSFLKQWGEAAYTSAGFFWAALWAFALGYVISSLIQVFVTQDRMKKSMGKAGGKEMGLATFFGFISSSCSFAALATAKSLFKKGAGFIPSMAFLLSSTNLVIELGIVISVFLTWQFVVGEYIGGILLILISWLFVKLTKPKKLIKKARERVQENEDEEEEDEVPDWRQEIKTMRGWKKVGMRYVMEWNMVWKDVTVGFTVAGIIAAFVPKEFFETLFVGTGQGNQDFSFLQVLEHTVVGPIAAFLTFIGSMGNIPLASLLYSNGVSFAGVMAFIFSDLVVFPVMRIHANYYGWKMSLYITLMLFTALVGATLLLHYGFSLSGFMPESSGGSGMQDKEHFKIDYTFFLNLAFLAVSGILAWLHIRMKNDSEGTGMSMEMASKGKLDVVLKYVAWLSYIWLAGGLIVKLFVN